MDVKLNAKILSSKIIKNENKLQSHIIILQFDNNSIIKVFMSIILPIK